MRRAVVIALLVGCGRVGFDAATADVDADYDAAIEPLTITRLWIYDPPTGAALQEVTNGGSLDLRDHPDGITIYAEAAGTPRSVEFVRNGITSVELTRPFTSGGNMGAQLGADHGLVVGPNQLAVTAYEFADKTGARGATKTVTIALDLVFIAPPAIMRAGFVTGDNTGFVELRDGMTYSKTTLPSTADLRMEPTPPVVGSIVVGGVGPWNPGLENYRPYTAMGTGRTFTPAVGTYTLQATAYTQGKGMGTAGPRYTVTFSIGP